MATARQPPAPRPAAPEPPDEAAELTAATLERPRARLTPADLQALNETWRECALADDDEAKALARRIVARLRRATHEELHPGCQRITIDVPQLPNGHFVQINTRRYIGLVEVWACEAQTILELVWHARGVEAARLRDDGRTIDLDREALADRARAIQRA